MATNIKFKENMETLTLRYAEKFYEYDYKETNNKLLRISLLLTEEIRDSDLL